MLNSSAVSLFGLEKQAELLSQDLSHITRHVLHSANYIRGPETSKFEDVFSKFLGSGSGISVGNGSDAIFIALRALNIGPGDEVIVPNLTFIATWLAALNTGAKVVGVDVEDDGLLSIPKTLQAVNQKTKCIIPVHLYGKMVDVKRLRSKLGGFINIVEDAAQAHESFLPDQRLGEYSEAVAFSFYPTKTIGCFGDGGFIYSKSKMLIESCKKIANYGASIKYNHDLVGYNSRLDELQAAYLNQKLQYVDDWVAKRRLIAQKLASACDGKILRPVSGLDFAGHAVHLLVLEVENRSELVDNLNTNKFDYGFHYPIIPIKQKCFQGDIISNGRVSSTGHQNAFKLSQTIISIPCHQFMSSGEVSILCNILESHVEKFS